MARRRRDALLDTERQMADWQRAHRGAPGVELHGDPDVTWMLTHASAWSNCAVMARFTQQTVRDRLGQLYEHYEAHRPRLEIIELDSHDRYRTRGHPSYGPITTSRREFRLAAMESIMGRRPRRTWEWIALDGEAPVGCVTIHLSRGVAGVYDVGVRESHRRRGIGTALVRRACAFAFSLGAGRAVLLATGEGEAMYPRAGFREVGRIAYWYRSVQRGA